MKSASLDITEVIDLENDATKDLMATSTHDDPRNVSNTSTLSSIMYVSHTLV